MSLISAGSISLDSTFKWHERNQIFYWSLHFLTQIIVPTACLQKTGFACNWPLALAKFACDWRPVANNFYPSGRQSHATWIKSTEICMRLAASRVQFACDWRPLRYNLHMVRLAGHSVIRQETSWQEMCKRPSLHHNYIILALASPDPRRMLLTFHLTALGYLVWKMRWYYGWHSHTEANLACASGHCVQSHQFF